MCECINPGSLTWSLTDRDYGKHKMNKLKVELKRETETPVTIKKNDLGEAARGQKGIE